MGKGFACHPIDLLGNFPKKNGGSSMPGVFVSYCRPSAQIAEQVAAALSSMGYDVWRDDQLPAHRAYGDVIEENLRSAHAVVVLWSSEACQSQWVRAEADYARQAGILVQASLDGTIPPLPFNQIQCADLAEWDGGANSRGWQKVVRSVAALAPVGADGMDDRASYDRLSICVLPFENMSGDIEQEYFSDGISEDITTDLSKVSALAVTARNTAFTYKGQAVDVCKVSRALHVSHILEGSVRKAGERLRITAQLIDGATGDHLWAERYDRELTDIFAIQDEISHAIVEALQVKLLPAEKLAIEQRGTTNAEAYNLYLMARNCWIAGDFSDARRVGRVIRICHQAIELDPDYAQAWALIALGQAHVFHGIGPNEGTDDGAVAAKRAMTLDPNIAEARLPMAWRLIAEGRNDEANAELAAALQSNPNSWEVNKEAARLFYRQRRISDAAFHLERATEIVPADFHGWGMLFACYSAQGDSVRARECATKIIPMVEEVVARDPDNGIALAMGANSFGALGQWDQARQWISRAERFDPGNLFMRYNLAFGLAGAFNDKDAAIEMVAPVLAKGGPSTIRLAAADPNFDSLRDDARFRAMMDDAFQRLGIEPAVATPAAT
jgi:adenylate cyclase